MAEIQDDRYSSGLYKKMFGCPLYIQNTKKDCFVRLRVCLYTPIHLGAPVHKQHKESMLCPTKKVSICPNTFGCPLNV